MGIVDKLTGRSSSSSSKHSNTDTMAPSVGNESALGGSSDQSYTGAHSTPGSSGIGEQNSGLTSDTQRHKGVGEKVEEAVGLDPKYNDPKDAGYSSTSTSTTTGTSGTTERHKGIGEKAKEAVGLDPKYNDPKDAGYSTSSTSTSTTERGLDRETERMGGMSLGSNSTTRDRNDPMNTVGHTEVRTAAPVVAEHIHDEYTEIDKTRVEELRDRTQVKQIVQPVRDERTEALQRDRVDHGLEVHEHGEAGLDARTKAELAAKREELAMKTRSTHDERTTETTERPSVDVQERTNYVEEVVPVVEKDIYRPHETEHHKRIVNIHHEAPVLVGTKVNPAISLKEWESQGHSISGATTTSTRQRTGSSSSSSSSDNEGTGRTGTTRRKKSLGEKVKEAVGLDPKDGRDPKDAAYNNQSTGYNSQSSSSTGYSNTNIGGSSAGYDQTSGFGADETEETRRKKGLGEKVKEAVGLDPKDGHGDPKDAAYNNQSTGYNTGYNNNQGTSGVGSSSGGLQSRGMGATSEQINNNSSYGSSSTTGGVNSVTDRHKGLGEKLGEQLGVDPKDSRDPKDRNIAGNSGLTTIGTENPATVGDRYKQ